MASCTLDRNGLLRGSYGGGPGTTTTSSVGGATTSTGNPTAGGDTPGVENCRNGMDDDGDGLADCADSDCDAGYTCVPSAPSADAYVTSTVVNFTAPRACNNGPSGDRSINVLISTPNNDGSCQPASPTTTAQPVSTCAASATGSCEDSNQVCVPATVACEPSARPSGNPTRYRICCTM